MEIIEDYATAKRARKRAPDEDSWTSVDHQELDHAVRPPLVNHSVPCFIFIWNFPHFLHCMCVVAPIRRRTCPRACTS